MADKPPGPNRQAGLRPSGWRAPGPHRPSLRALGLLLAALCLVLALINPGVMREQALFEQVVVLDITQSMDVQDQSWAGVPVSRLQASKRWLHEALAQMPCGSRLGWGVFTEHRSVLLLAPVEVCAHLSDLRQSLAQIDGRMAWSGNSEVAKGVHSALILLAQLPGKPSLVFVTDGHEAPPLDPAQRPRFDGTPGEPGGVMVGVGGPQLAPIPRSDPMGRPLGVWTAEQVLQTNPYLKAREGQGRDDRSGATPSAPGATPGREHLSSLRESYLRLLAGETGLTYVAAGGGAVGAMPGDGRSVGGAAGQSVQLGQGGLAAQSGSHDAAQVRLMQSVLTAPEQARPVMAKTSLRVPLAALALGGLLLALLSGLTRFAHPR